MYHAVAGGAQRSDHVAQRAAHRRDVCLLQMGLDLHQVVRSGQCAVMLFCATAATNVTACALPRWKAMRTPIPYLCAVLVAGLFAAGCMVGSDEDSAANDDADGLSGYDALTVTPLSLASNRRTAYDFFKSKGLSGRQSAGIVGNLMQESSVDPRAIQFGGGAGRGIAQWSTGGRWNASFHDNVTWYAAQHHETRWALHTQLEFVWYELTHFSGYGLGALRAQPWTAGATIVFERDFEKCGVCDEARRIAFARSVYREFRTTAMETGEDEADVLADSDEQSEDAEP
jgi:hypothetical protein